jgi:flagellar biosynthetic protein FliR
MTFTSAQLTAWVGAFLWPLFRIGAMMMVAPVYGSRLVPVRIRLGIALALAILVAPLLPAVPAVEVFSFEALFIIAQQILIGVAMGFALQIVISAVITGGQVIAMQMGLGFSVMVDPQNGAQTPVLSQFYVIMVVLVFLALNGHLVMIEVLLDSFRTLPISSNGLVAADLWQLVSWGSMVFSGAVGMAIPAIASLLIVNFAFGIMTRAAPQLNIFAIGFPIIMMLGFAVVIITLPSVLPRSSGMFTDAYHLIRDLSSAGAP